jgi:hypothetical protein
MHSGEQHARSSHKLFTAGKCGKLQYDVVSRLTNEEGDLKFKLEILIMDVIASKKECQNALRRATRHVLTQVARRTDVDSGYFKNILY